VPSSSLSTVSAAEASNVVYSSAELLAAVEYSLHCPVTSVSSSQALNVESHQTGRASPASSAVTGTGKVAELCSIKPLVSSESSPDLGLCSEDVSVNSESAFDDQEWTDGLFRNNRNISSSSLTEMCDNQRVRTGTNSNRNRKRKLEVELPEYRGLTFDKVPNYYTALSIPNRVTAGSAARSSSDLIADFVHNEREPSPERKSCSVYDKLPAYYSSFTNSTRYDESGNMSFSQPMFENNCYQDETEYEGRHERSYDENYELRDLKSADELPAEESYPNDDHEEEETNTENVSHFISEICCCHL